MIVDKSILDALTAQAKVSPRLRMNLDLRNSAEDQSQRMLNAIELAGQWHNVRTLESSSVILE